MTGVTKTGQGDPADASFGGGSSVEETTTPQANGIDAMAGYSTRVASTIPMSFAAPPTWGQRIRATVGVVSPLGWMVFLAAGVSGFSGWRLGWPELLILSMTGFIALTLSIPFVFGDARLNIDIDVHPQRVVAGERSAGEMSVQNISGRRLFPLQVELKVGEGAAEFDIPSLKPHEIHEELFVLPTERRAIIPVGPATSVRSDPLGLLRRTKKWSQPIPLFVHPRTVLLSNLGTGILRDLEGQASSTLTDSDLSFHALRDYEPGDDRRFIHWLTTARVGHLVVRQFIETRRSHIAIVVDGSPESYRDEDEFELAVSIAASLGVRMLQDEQELTAVACGHPLVTSNTVTLLDGFAGVKQVAKRADLLTQADKLGRESTGVSVAIFVTGSNQPVSDFRSISLRLPVDTYCIAIRADVGAKTTFQQLGVLEVLTVGDLAELPSLMWRVSEQ